MNIILDACAVVALFSGEAGHDVVDAVPTEHTCFMHAINLSEVHRIYAVRVGIEAADVVVSDFRQLGVEIREDLDASLCRDAIAVSMVGRAAFGDYFAMALARRVEGTVLTCDHKEISEHAAAKTCSIHFFRTAGPKDEALSLPLP